MGKPLSRPARAYLLRNRLTSANGGFTLVEVMLAVAIIGILASVALPNYQNFQARSRQTEAKLSLASFYTAQMAFFADNASYTTCAATAGFVRTGLGFRYTIGFGDPQATCGQTGAEDCHQVQFANPLPCPEGAFPLGALTLADRAAMGLPVTRADFVGATTTEISTAAFKAAAVGRISHRNAMVLDVWTINERKQINNEVLGF